MTKTPARPPHQRASHAICRPNDPPLPHRRRRSGRDHAGPDGHRGAGAITGAAGSAAPAPGRSGGMAAAHRLHGPGAAGASYCRAGSGSGRLSYSKVRENLAAVWNEIEDSREEVILRRRGPEDLALLPAHELQSLKETAHLLRLPANAALLLTALARSRTAQGESPIRVYRGDRQGGGAG